jgi:hypothetical protein
MSDTIIPNYITKQFKRGAKVHAPHPDTGHFASGQVSSYIVTGAAQNIPCGVIVEFEDNSMGRFEQGDIDHEVIKLA